MIASDSHVQGQSKSGPVELYTLAAMLLALGFASGFESDLLPSKVKLDATDRLGTSLAFWFVGPATPP